MKFYKYVLILGAVLITGVFLTSTLAQSFSTLLYRPIVVVFGDSSEVEKTVYTLVTDYPSVIVINYQDIYSLVSVLTLMRSHSPLILVGHGSEYGILGPHDAMISWQDIGTWVNTLPTTFVFFLACDSNDATKFVQTHSYGFSGTIDGVLGAITIAANLQYATGNMKAVQQLIAQYVSRVIVLQSDKAKLMPLICYYGPAQSSSSSSNNISSNVIPCPPPPPSYTVTFTESGLPAGTSWSVIFGGGTHTSTTSSISFTVGTSAYSYSIPSIFGYSATPSSGLVNVDRDFIGVSITFIQAPKIVPAILFGSCTINPDNSLWNSPPKYIFYCIGPIEAKWDLANLAMITASALLTFSGPVVVPQVGMIVQDGVLALIGIGEISGDMIGFYNALCDFLAALTGQMSDLAAVVSALISLLPIFIIFLINVVVPQLGLTDQVIALGDILAEQAAIFGTGGIASVIKATEIAAAILGFAWWITGVGSDLYDVDDVANMPSLFFGG